MGTTFCSIHVYTAETVSSGQFRFQSYSENWHTCVLGKKESSDPEISSKFAKKISKNLEVPVLWFCELDSDYIFFEFFQQGKIVSRYSSAGDPPDKGLRKIPQLVGYEDGHKRQLSRILGCPDLELQIELLEEYLGVCLLPMPELTEENNGDAEVFRRVRGEVLYRKFEQEEKALTGKNAAFQVEVVQELEGILNRSDWGNKWYPQSELPAFRKTFYIYEKSLTTWSKKRPVCFRNGKIEFISDEEMRQKGLGEPRHTFIGENPALYKDDLYTKLLTFSDKVPSGYAERTVKLPPRLYPLGFSASGNFILHNDRGTIAVVDANMYILAKHHLKGQILELNGDYILTLESRKTIYGMIRVYHLFEKEK